MSDPALIRDIKRVVTIPVMAKARIGHFVEEQILEAHDKICRATGHHRAACPSSPAPAGSAPPASTAPCCASSSPTSHHTLRNLTPLAGGTPAWFGWKRGGADESGGGFSPMPPALSPSPLTRPSILCPFVFQRRRLREVGHASLLIFCFPFLTVVGGDGSDVQRQAAARARCRPSPCLPPLRPGASTPEIHAPVRSSLSAAPSRVNGKRSDRPKIPATRTFRRTCASRRGCARRLVMYHARQLAAANGAPNSAA